MKVTKVWNKTTEMEWQQMERAHVLMFSAGPAHAHQGTEESANQMTMKDGDISKMRGCSTRSKQCIWKGSRLNSDTWKVKTKREWSLGGPGLSIYSPPVPSAKPTDVQIKLSQNKAVQKLLLTQRRQAMNIWNRLLFLKVIDIDILLHIFILLIHSLGSLFTKTKSNPHFFLSNPIHSRKIFKYIKG